MKNSNPFLLVLVTAAVTAILCFRFPEPVAGFPQAERQETVKGRGQFQLETATGGYYVLDTHTGAVWFGIHGRPPRALNDSL